MQSVIPLLNAMELLARSIEERGWAVSAVEVEEDDGQITLTLTMHEPRSEDEPA